MRALLVRLFWGAVAVALLGLPLWVGLSTYWIVRLSGHANAGSWGKLSAFAVLFMYPLMMLGHALAQSHPHKSTAMAKVPVNWEPNVALADAVEIWKAALEVQKHFNDLELRIRNFAVTLLVAVLGATAFSLKEHYEVSMFGLNFPLAVAVLLAGILGWLAFFFMDRYWYHNLLLGSVFHTLRIEQSMNERAPLGLSVEIGKQSPVHCGKFEVHSSEKIDLFYAAGLMFLVLVAFFVLFSTTPTAPLPEVARPGAATFRPSAADSTPPKSAIEQPQVGTAAPNTPEHVQAGTNSKQAPPHPQTSTSTAGVKSKSKGTKKS